MKHYFTLADYNGFSQQVFSLDELFQALKAAKILGLDKVYLTKILENNKRIAKDSSITISLSEAELSI